MRFCTQLDINLQTPKRLVHAIASMLFLIRFYSLVRLTISMGYPLVAPVPSEAGYARICLLALVTILWQCLGGTAPVHARDGLHGHRRNSLSANSDVLCCVEVDLWH
jgi:hypothetical protein